EVRKELQAVYAAALEKFREQAATSDPTLVPFMERVLAVLNEAGASTLQVQFARPTGEALQAADRRIAQDSKGREIAPVARHFAADSAGPRETRIVTEMARGFAAIFAGDVLKVETVGKPDDKLPRMDIAYRIEPSGTLYKLDDSQRF